MKGRFVAVLAAIALIFGSVTAAVPAQAAPGNFVAPFSDGLSTCVYQGYGPAYSHNGTSQYGLDLVAGDCGSTNAAGRAVRTPLSGTIHYWQASTGTLCVNTGDGRSVALTHINASVTSGPVTAGQTVGAVAVAGQRSNAGIAHLHFQIWASSGCWATGNGGIPFDAAHNARICGAQDLTPGGPNGLSNGAWSGATFAGDSCGAPPPPDADGDSMPDASDILPTIAGPSNNRGAPLQPTRLSGDYDGDGKLDVAVFYNYDNDRTKIQMFYGNGGGAYDTPFAVWDSGVGSWEWRRIKPVVGDFNSDGRADIAAFYDYDNATKLWLFAGSSSRTFSSPTLLWDSGVGNWEWQRTLPISGDFDGDSKIDIAAFYDYGGGRTKIQFFKGQGDGSFASPQIAWDSGPGSWEWQRIKPVVGDFNSDGRADIAAFYDYGSALTKIWSFNGESNGTFSGPTLRFDSGVGNWEWPRALPLAGDFNGDGKVDITVLYNYDNSTSKMHIFVGDGAGGLAWPQLAWSSGAGNWDWNRSKPVVGEFTGDGKADITFLYNYDNAQTKVWQFLGSSSNTFASPTFRWDSGIGNWEWPRVLTP